MYCEQCGSQVDTTTGVCAACAGRFQAGKGNTAVSRPRLEWRGGLLTGQSTELTSDYMIVGKDTASCQVVVDNDVVSFRHSALEVDGQFEVTLVDLASAGGTFVNGARISRQSLRDGDVVAFGPGEVTSCVFRAARAPLPALSAPFAPPSATVRVSTGAEQAATELTKKVKTASKDATQALKTFATNPVGGLPVAFEGLGPSRAMGVGLVFAAASTLLVFIGVYLSLPSFVKPDIGDSFKFLVFGVVPFASILAASAATRKMFGGTGSFGGDSLIAGASLLPFGFLVFVSGVLGLANLEVTALLVIFALCYSILILYTGCTRISGVPESKAAFAVPVMIIVSGWLTKILFGAILPSFLPSPTRVIPFGT